MQVQLWIPDKLQPSTCIVLCPVHIRGNKKALVLSEDLGLPVRVEGVRAIYKAIGDGPSTGQEKCTDFVLAITCLDSCTRRKPVACSALNGATVTADRVSNQKAFVCISIEVLAIREEVVWTDVFRKAFGADGFHTQVHVRQEG